MRLCDEESDETSVNRLFVADKTDLAGFGIDAGALAFDDVDGLAIETDRRFYLAFRLGNAAAVVENLPVDFAVRVGSGADRSPTWPR